MELPTIPEQLPAVVWMVIGAFIPLLITVVTNWSNSSLQQRRLQNEHEAREAERLHSMRRDIYLNTVTVLGDASRKVIRMLYDAPGSVDMLAELGPLMESMQKTQLVGTVQTAKVTGRVMGSILALALMSGKRANSLNALKEERSRCEKELHDFAQISPQGNSRADEFIAMHDNLDSTTKVLNDLFMDFTRLQAQEAEILSSYTTELVTAMKSDLGVGGDLNDFNEHLEEYKRILYKARDAQAADLAL